MKPRRRRHQRHRRTLRATARSFGVESQVPNYPINELVVELLVDGRFNRIVVGLWRYRNGGFVGAGWRQ